MKKTVCALAIAFGALFASAMPSKNELSKARAFVQELMAPVMSGYQAKTKTAIEVADTSIEFAKKADNEAVRFVFLRGSVNYYIIGEDYNKAAEILEELKENFDVPPAEIVSLLIRANRQGRLRKSPRLESMFRFAQAQVQAEKDRKELAVSLKNVASGTLRRQYAETLAVLGNWEKALTEFGKSDGNVAEIAKADLSGTGDALEIGDFWWSYKGNYKGGEIVFRNRAADYYRKAIAEGKVDGLKKTLVEQRLALLVLADVCDSVVENAVIKEKEEKENKKAAKAGRKQSQSAKMRFSRGQNASHLVHRWSFEDGYDDSVGNMSPSKSDNATVNNGVAELKSGSPLEFPAGAVPRAPFTVQVWASATGKGLGADGNFIFKIASSNDSKDDCVYWTWRASTKWVSKISAFGTDKSVGHGILFVDGKSHLYTVTAEKAGSGMNLKFYQDDTFFGELKAPKAWKKPPMLILGGFVTPTYDEVRVYSRALSHAEIITSINEGMDKH